VKAPGRTKEVTVRANTTLSALAKSLVITLTQLIEMNPGITRLPYVPAGTVVVTRA
jgi:hypothetical protein